MVQGRVDKSLTKCLTSIEGTRPCEFFAKESIVCAHKYHNQSAPSVSMEKKCCNESNN